MKKPYLPLMMGDWTQGTRAMRAEVKGVYIGLLIEQYDKGFIPADLSILALIEPEVGKVWDTLRDKFQEFEPGKLRNQKLEEVRAFWSKQAKNAKLGGRPKQTNPNNIPKTNPNPILHNDTDLDIDIELKSKISVPPEFKQDAQLDQWEGWGDQIVTGNDFGWDAMRGRKVARDEMDAFLSVATRNDWKMESQQAFRNTLRGFDQKKGGNGQQPKKLVDLTNL